MKVTPSAKKVALYTDKSEIKHTNWYDGTPIQNFLKGLLISF